MSFYLPEISALFLFKEPKQAVCIAVYLCCVQSIDVSDGIMLFSEGEQ